MTDDSARFDDPAFRMDREGRRGGRSGCLFGCMLGCGIAALLAIVVIGALVWFGYRFASQSMSQDPVKIEQWAKDIVPCAIPGGYEGKFGMDFTFSGVGVKIAVIAPQEVDYQAGHAADDEHTVFVLMGAMGMGEEDAAGQLQMQQQQHNWGGRQDPPHKTTRVEFAVDGRKLPATKSEWLKGDEVEAIAYQLMLRPGVMLFVHGPGKEFDQKAFDELIASIKLLPDQPPVAPQQQQ